MNIVLSLILIMALADSAAAQAIKETPAPGRYQIATGREVAFDYLFLVDTWTGRTWRYQRGAWLPDTKLDTKEQASEWVKGHQTESEINRDKLRGLPKK